jgi:hypothetical protein
VVLQADWHFWVDKHNCGRLTISGGYSIMQDVALCDCHPLHNNKPSLVEFKEILDSDMQHAAETQL